MNAPVAVTWIFVLFLLLTVFGAFAAIIWRSWIVGSIVLLFTFLIFGLYFVRSVPSGPPAMIQGSITATVDRSEPDIEFLKTANIYSSMEEAAKFLAMRLCDQIQRSQPLLAVSNIHIVTANQERAAEILTEVFRDEYPRANVVADNIHNSDPSQLLVTLEIQNSGKCPILRATQDGRTFKEDACVKEARWVSDLDQYKREKGNEDLVVGSSSMAEISPDLANERAREDAAIKMLPFITAKFPELNAADPHWLQIRVRQEIAGRKLVTDSFPQTLRTPVVGTTVYRSLVLVDASSSQMEKLHPILSEYHHRNDRVHRFGGGVGGMALVICLVYLFLNRATRGYFQMNLRLAAFLVLIGGVLLLMMIG
jgi:hypothetical protein